MSSVLPHEYRAPSPPAQPLSPGEWLDEELEPVRRPRELGFAEWATGVLSRWRMVGVCVALALLGAAAAAVVLPPVYRSHASFVTAGGGGLKLPAGLGTAGLAGLATQLGVTTGSEPSESPNFYAQLIGSRELQTRLLFSRFADPRTSAPGDSATLLELLEIRGRDRDRALEIGLKKLSKRIVVGFDVKTNLVSMRADAEWRELSAAVANRAVELVSSFNLEQRQSRARLKRSFIQSRLDSAQLALDDAERRVRAFYEQNRQWRSSPALLYEEGRLTRQVDVASDLYLTLRREFESARIEEVNDAARITVVDSAVVPRRRQWPRLAPLFLASLFVGLGAGILVAGGATVAADWAARNPGSAGDLRRMVARVGREMRSLVPRGRRAAHAARRPVE